MILALLTAGSFVLSTAGARSSEDASQPLPYRLETVKYIDRFVGSDEAKKLLGKQGFVVTAQQFPQIFAAYLELEQDRPCPPTFVTEDSVWHTYHVLLEDGIKELEERQTSVLRRFSARLLEAAQEKSRQRGDVYWDLAAFAAVGLVLQDAGAAASLPADLRSVVGGVIPAIETGNAPVSALFFGLPLAPERFRAASFYAKGTELRAYFKARQWYAICDFRQRSSPETERALHLALLIAGDPELRQLHERLCAPYDVLLGPPDDAGVPQYVELASEVIGGTPSADRIAPALDAFRQRAASLPDPKINDQLLLSDQSAHFAAETKGFRLLPPRRCPSAVLLQRTVSPLIKGREVPSGLDFFATGALACEPAKRALLASIGGNTTFDAIVGAKAEPWPDSLHGKALGLLRLLQEPLPDSAPLPLRTPAWQDKQLWTALGAWTEQRHTWAGHLKLTVTVLDGDQQPPGYVSPYPSFFRELGELARQTATVLNSLSEEPTPKQAGQELLTTLDIVRQAHKNSRWGDDAWKGDLRLHRFFSAYRLWTGRKDKWTAGESPWGASVMERLARRWIDGQNLDASDREAIRLWNASTKLRALHLLPELTELCGRLAAIAQKELNAERFDDEDIAVLQNFGLDLARLHFYESEAWMHPQDDFPLVTPVFASPIKDRILYAGLGRPEALYVIVDVDGQPVLYRGAVLSYREFTRPTEEPVDDSSWREEIRAGKTPAPPPFTNSFRKATPAEESSECERLRRWASDEDRLYGDRVRAQNPLAEEALQTPVASPDGWAVAIRLAFLAAIVLGFCVLFIAWRRSRSAGKDEEAT